MQLHSEIFSNFIGLNFDEDDVHFYTDLFREMGRNPTTVELFDLAQSNSEHSRHWFFNVSLSVEWGTYNYFIKCFKYIWLFFVS